MAARGRLARPRGGALRGPVCSQGWCCLLSRSRGVGALPGAARVHTASHLPAVLNEGNLYEGRGASRVMFYKCVFIRVLFLDFGKEPGHAVSVVARAAQWEAAPEEVLQ